MSKYEKYEEDIEYKDGADRKPRLIFILGIIMLLIIIIIIVVSCTSKSGKNSSNNNLLNIRISGGELSPMFSKNQTLYDVLTEEKKISIYCSAEDIKATTEGCNKTIDVLGTQMTHNIVVTARNGSKKTYKLVIGQKSDSVSVIIDSDIESGQISSKDVNLIAVVTPQIENVKYEWYKDNVLIKNAIEETYTAKESGNYYVKIKNDDNSIDVMSNTYEVSIQKNENDSQQKDNTSQKDDTSKKESSNTQTSKKFVLDINSITGNATTWVKSVTLKVNATSSNGLADKAYSFDGGRTYQKSNSKQFTKNEVVYIYVKDKTGKTVNKKVNITKIDSTKPVVVIKAGVISGGKVTLTASVNPSSTNSGYSFIWYKDGNKISGANNKTYTASSAGRYSVKVTTGSGISTTSANYQFSITSSIVCPTLLVTRTSGQVVEPQKWFNEVIYVSITPSSDTSSYDVYLNEDGDYTNISEKYTYFTTFNSAGKIKIVNGGKRKIKFIVRDKKGNSGICYSKVYYLKK